MKKKEWVKPDITIVSSYNKSLRAIIAELAGFSVTKKVTNSVTNEVKNDQKVTKSEKSNL